MCVILSLYISGENILTPLDISIYNFTYLTSKKTLAGRKIPEEEHNFQKYDEVYFIVNLYYSFSLHLLPQTNLSFPKKSHLPPPR